MTIFAHGYCFFLNLLPLTSMVDNRSLKIVCYYLYSKVDRNKQRNVIISDDFQHNKNNAVLIFNCLLVIIYLIH